MAHFLKNSIVQLMKVTESSGKKIVITIAPISARSIFNRRVLHRRKPGQCCGRILPPESTQLLIL